MADYLRGSGTQADPYVIHNEGAWEKFMSYSLYGANAGHRLAKYFEVVANIDCGGKTYAMGGNSGTWNAFLNLNGYTIKNFVLDGSNGGNAVKYLKSGYIKFGVLDFSISSSGYSLCDYCTLTMLNVCLIIRVGYLVGDGGTFKKDRTTSCVFIHSAGLKLFNYGAAEANPSVYYVTNSTLGIGLGTRVALADSTDPTKYPALPATHWVLDGVSWPRTIPTGRPELTNGYVVKGKTKVGGIGKSRDVLAIIAASYVIYKKMKSSADGSYQITLGDVFDPLIIVHHDYYGYPFTASATYALGDVIHPKTPNGYRYVCTTAGVAGTTEPVIWPTSGTLQSGAAIFTAEPVYKPESNLVSPAYVNLVTGELAA